MYWEIMLQITDRLNFEMLGMAVDIKMPEVKNHLELALRLLAIDDQSFLRATLTCL